MANQCFYNNVDPVNTSAITIGTMTYEWDFGDATALDLNTNPSHPYAVPGNYNITLTATSNFGCVHSVSNPVIAHAQPIAAFVVTDECVSFANGYTDMSTNPAAINGDAINDWDWDVDVNGSVDYDVQNPNHTYSSEGIYTTELTVTTAFGCSHTVQGPVTVFPGALC